MNSELVWVLCLLAGAIYLFMTNKVRMDVVALLIIILFVLSGTLTLPEALAGFSDPNVILIAALFVVGGGAGAHRHRLSGGGCIGEGGG